MGTRLTLALLLPGGSEGGSGEGSDKDGLGEHGDDNIKPVYKTGETKNEGGGMRQVAMVFICKPGKALRRPESRRR